MGYRLWGMGLLLALLAGCAVERPSPEHPEALVPDRSPEVAVGEMTRSEVRERFGQPVLGSEYWGFELFRAETEQAMTVYAITPWPIPFLWTKDRLLRYTLVAYDPGGRVGEVSSGLFRRPTDWRSGSPIKHDFPALHLRSSDLLFFIVPDGERRENLLAAPALRDAWLAHEYAPQDCTLVLGCGEQGCPDLLSVDGRARQRLPLRMTDPYWYREGEREVWLRGRQPTGGNPMPPWLETLVALRLPPGEHRLEFSAQYLDGRHTEELACRSGELGYLQVTATATHGFLKQELSDWQVSYSRTMPASFRQQPLVLVTDGAWQVEREP